MILKKAIILSSLWLKLLAFEMTIWFNFYGRITIALASQISMANAFIALLFNCVEDESTKREQQNSPQKSKVSAD